MAPDLPAMAALFFGAAVLYSSVGFGGGSAYLALLALSTVPLAQAGTVALVCNVIVVTGGTWHFVRAGHFRGDMVWPFLLSSVPAAYGGGRWAADLDVLPLVTAAALTAAALVMLAARRREAVTRVDELPRRRLWAAALPLGAGLGGLAGLIGIGGGVFLAPALHLLHWGTPQQVAATTAVFILVNSLAGLAGRLVGPADPLALAPFGLLFVAVLAGGQIGSRLGARRLSPQGVRRLTAVVLLVAAAHLALGG